MRFTNQSRTIKRGWRGRWTGNENYLAHRDELLMKEAYSFFSKMPCNKPIQRASWSLEIGQPLYLQPGDKAWSWRETGLPGLEVKDIFLRVDWQTLRRLPRSQAIVFNFKPIFTPITSFRNEPYIPRLLLKILREANRPLLEDKTTPHIERKLIPALEEWSLEQEEKGWVPREWKEGTLNEVPFFPGWAKQMSW